MTNAQVALQDFARSFVTASDVIHRQNEKWWIDLESGERIERNVGECLMLIVSELAEASEGTPEYHLLIMEVVKRIVRAMEGHRKGLPDDKLPEFPMFDVEIADALIRILDLAGGLGKASSIAAAFVAKNEYNLHRADHKVENRKLAGGKKY